MDVAKAKAAGKVVMGVRGEDDGLRRRQAKFVRDMALSFGKHLADDPIPLQVRQTRSVIEHRGDRCVGAVRRQGEVAGSLQTPSARWLFQLACATSAAASSSGPVDTTPAEPFPTHR